jgi:hypothetical protein
MGPGNGDEFLGIWLALPCALTEGAPNIGVGCHVTPACWCSRNSGFSGGNDGFGCSGIHAIAQRVLSR